MQSNLLARIEEIMCFGCANVIAVMNVLERFRNCTKEIIILVTV